MTSFGKRRQQVHLNIETEHAVPPHMRHINEFKDSLSGGNMSSSGTLVIHSEDEVEPTPSKHSRFRKFGFKGNKRSAYTEDNSPSRSRTGSEGGDSYLSKKSPHRMGGLIRNSKIINKIKNKKLFEHRKKDRRKLSTTSQQSEDSSVGNETMFEDEEDDYQRYYGSELKPDSLLFNLTSNTANTEHLKRNYRANMERGALDLRTTLARNGSTLEMPVHPSPEIPLELKDEVKPSDDDKNNSAGDDMSAYDPAVIKKRLAKLEKVYKADQERYKNIQTAIMNIRDASQLGIDQLRVTISTSQDEIGLMEDNIGDILQEIQVKKQRNHEELYGEIRAHVARELKSQEAPYYDMMQKIQHEVQSFTRVSIGSGEGFFTGILHSLISLVLSGAGVIIDTVAFVLSNVLMVILFPYTIIVKPFLSCNS